MASHFSALIDIESRSADVKNPSPSHPRTPTSPSALELDDLNWGGRYTGPSTPADALQHAYSGVQTPKSPNEFTISRPPTPRQEEATGLAASWSNPPMNRWRILCVSLTYFANGMSDSAPGPLIPYMEAYYKVGYAIVSLIFVSNAIGFICAAVSTVHILQGFGRARTLMFAEVLLVASYTVVVCTPPFAAVVVAYFFMGFAFALTLSLNNVFVGTLADSTVLLGFAQGAYGVGATIGPVVATIFVSQGLLWSRYFCVTLALRFLCFAFDGWAFWNIEKEAATRLHTALQRAASRHSEELTTLQLLMTALKDKVTLVGALYTFAYQGAEVSISGWVISFLITYRHGDPTSVGYVTAGFWGGITVGRFAFSHAINRIGEKRSLFALTVGAIIFQLIVWQVPNIIGDAVAVSIVGLLLGPAAPCSTVLFLRLLPRDLQTTSISFISSAGSSGGAVVPFLTGLVAQKAGTWVLHPIAVAFFVVMLGCWAVLPKVERRDE